MFSSFLSFCLRFFRSRIQLQLEIIFLRKQSEILARLSTRPRAGLTNPRDGFPHKHTSRDTYAASRLMKKSLLFPD